jgi:hypothetical protein
MPIRLACSSACALILVLAGCGEAPPRAPESTQTVEATAGIPGGVITNQTVVNARVTFKNTEKRQVTLLNADGKQQLFDVPAEVVNFDQVNAGDLLVITSTEQIAIVVFNAATPVEQGEAAVVARAEKGQRPAGVIATVTQFRGVVSAINLEQRTVTIAMDGGKTRVLPVRDDIDLTKHKVGEQVVMRITEAIELRVEAKADPAK